MIIRKQFVKTQFTFEGKNGDLVQVDVLNSFSKNVQLIEKIEKLIQNKQIIL